MKPSNTLLAAAALAALALSGCDDHRSRSDDDREAVQIEQEAPPPVEQQAPTPPPEVRDLTPTPPPSDRLPPEERSSEQSVQPESDTLFY